MKQIFFILILLIGKTVSAQKIDSIYINLYTDSLKKGTHNYINVDGLLSNGQYLPLDSTHLLFATDYGYFSGNSLVLPFNVTQQRVHVKVQLRANKKVCKDFYMFIKTSPDPDLPTEAEILNTPVKKTSKKKNSRN